MSRMLATAGKQFWRSRTERGTAAGPIASGRVVRRIARAREDEFVRDYVSRLWAEDWDSREDSTLDHGVMEGDVNAQA